jgi:Ca2+-binding EF-hand superfamily protein
MGGAMIIPEADEKINKAIKTFRLTQKEISDLFMVFLKLDKQKIGFINLDDLWKMCELTGSMYTEAILDVFEITHDGSINFRCK